MALDNGTPAKSAARSSVEEFGLEGPDSVAVSTQPDEAKRRIVEGFLEKARAIRPILRAEQAETERNAKYSERVHQYFLENDMYKLMMPKRFGGYELSVSDLYLVVAEIARGCPSTAWCFCLGSAHALQLSSYWPLSVQEEIYAQNGYFIAPGSSKSRDARAEKVDGGYLVSGTWHYSSGAPYSTHFLPIMHLPGNPDDVFHWLIIPRESFEILGDWGSILGMRGSGSNTIRIKNAFVPERYTVVEDFGASVSGPTVGSRQLGNSLYGGSFHAFAFGEISAITVGLGYAALDEYRRILSTSQAILSPDTTVKKIDHEDWQRSYGLALAKVDAAAASCAQNGQLYDAYSRRSAEEEIPFTEVLARRLCDSHLVVQDMIFEAVTVMLRGTGSSSLLDGQKMQRYYRDITTAVTRANQLDFSAASTTRAVVAER